MPEAHSHPAPPPAMKGHMLGEPSQHRLFLVEHNTDGPDTTAMDDFARVRHDGSIDDMDRAPGDGATAVDSKKTWLELKKQEFNAGTITKDQYELAKKEYGEEHSRHVNNPPAGYTHRGQHAIYAAPRTKEEFEIIDKDPDIVKSRSMVRQMINQIIDTGEMRNAREDRLLREPVPPRSMSDEQAEELKPKIPYPTPTRSDFRIDIDRLQRDRQTKILVPDDAGRKPEHPDYEEKWAPKTKLTLAQIERYVTPRQTGEPVPAGYEEYDSYLNNPVLTTEKPKELTSFDKAVVFAQLQLAARVGAGTPFEIEHLDAISNAHLGKKVAETTNTGPDTFLRAAFKYRPDGTYNSDGSRKYRDGKGNLIAPELIPIREKMIHLIAEDPAYLTALLNYDGGTSKAVPDDYYDLIQAGFDIGIEALNHKYNDDIPQHGYNRLMGHIIGYLYIIKGANPFDKNSDIENTNLLDENGNIQWESPLDAYGRTFLMDQAGNPVMRDHIVYDSEGNAYHRFQSKADRDAGSMGEYSKLIPLEQDVVRRVDPVSGKLVPIFETNPDGSQALFPVFTDSGDPVLDDAGAQLMKPRTLKEYVEHKKPVKNKNQFELTHVRLEDAVTDMTQRGPVGQAQYGQFALEAYSDIVCQILEEMDESYYFPGYIDGVDNALTTEPENFHKSQKIVMIDGQRTIVEVPYPKRKTVGDRNMPLEERSALGRLAKNYRLGLYSLSAFNLMMGDFSRASLPIQEGGEAPEGPSPEEIIAASRGRTREGDASGYQISPVANALLRKMAIVTRAGAKRHGLGKDENGMDQGVPRDVKIPKRSVFK